jgi:uncharacterized protein YggT (Ycf19 family)
MSIEDIVTDIEDFFTDLDLNFELDGTDELGLTSWKAVQFIQFGLQLRFAMSWFVKINPYWKQFGMWRHLYDPFVRVFYKIVPVVPFIDSAMWVLQWVLDVALETFREMYTDFD